MVAADGHRPDVGHRHQVVEARINDVAEHSDPARPKRIRGQGCHVAARLQCDARSRFECAGVGFGDDVERFHE